MDIESIQSAITSYHLDGADHGDEDLLEMFMRLKSPEECIDYAQSLKITGNSLFKQGKYQDAFTCYLKAVKAICVVVSCDGEGKMLLKDLATALNLNLAMCALHSCNYLQAKNLCSLVLGFDPRNTKALFRRACAFIKLGLVKEAHCDLLKASSFDANNKEVLKKLAELEGLPRCPQEGTDPLTEGLGSQGKDVVGKTISIAPDEVDGSSSNVLEKEEHVEEKPLPTTSDTTSTTHGVKIATQNVFVNRRQPSSVLRVSQLGLEQLAQGKQLVFFHPRSCSVMYVRAVTPTNQIMTEAPHDFDSREAEASTILPQMEEDPCVPVAPDSAPHAFVTPFIEDSIMSEVPSSPSSAPQVVRSYPLMFAFSAVRRKFTRPSLPHRKFGPHLRKRSKHSSKSPPPRLSGTKRKLDCNQFPIFMAPSKKKKIVLFFFSPFSVFKVGGLSLNSGFYVSHMTPPVV